MDASCCIDAVKEAVADTAVRATRGRTPRCFIASHLDQNKRAATASRVGGKSSSSKGLGMSSSADSVKPTGSHNRTQMLRLHLEEAALAARPISPAVILRDARQSALLRANSEDLSGAK
jgi:hypothetical protein